MILAQGCMARKSTIRTWASLPPKATPSTAAHCKRKLTNGPWDFAAGACGRGADNTHPSPGRPAALIPHNAYLVSLRLAPGYFYSALAERRNTAWANPRAGPQRARHQPRKKTTAYFTSYDLFSLAASPNGAALSEGPQQGLVVSQDLPARSADACFSDQRGPHAPG